MEYINASRNQIATNSLVNATKVFEDSAWNLGYMTSGFMSGETAYGKCFGCVFSAYDEDLEKIYYGLVTAGADGVDLDNDDLHPLLLRVVEGNLDSSTTDITSALTLKLSIPISTASTESDGVYGWEIMDWLNQWYVIGSDDGFPYANVFSMIGAGNFYDMTIVGEGASRQYFIKYHIIDGDSVYGNTEDNTTAMAVYDYQWNLVGKLDTQKEFNAVVTTDGKIIEFNGADNKVYEISNFATFAKTEKAASVISTAYCAFLDKTVNLTPRHSYCAPDYDSTNGKIYFGIECAMYDGATYKTNLGKSVSGILEYTISGATTQYKMTVTPQTYAHLVNLPTCVKVVPNSNYVISFSHYYCTYAYFIWDTSEDVTDILAHVSGFGTSRSPIDSLVDDGAWYFRRYEDNKIYKYTWETSGSTITKTEIVSGSLGTADSGDYLFTQTLVKTGDDFLIGTFISGTTGADLVHTMYFLDISEGLADATPTKSITLECGGYKDTYNKRGFLAPIILRTGDSNTYEIVVLDNNITKGATEIFFGAILGYAPYTFSGTIYAKENRDETIASASLYDADGTLLTTSGSDGTFSVDIPAADASAAYEVTVKAARKENTTDSFQINGDGVDTGNFYLRRALRY